MKYKIEFYLAALFLTLSLNSSAMAGRTLDGTKVVSDEDIEWLADEGYVTTRKFIQQAQALDPTELAEVDTLDLQGALLGSSGLKIIADDLLPYLPNLKLLNLYGSQLRSREDLALLASILDRFNSLQYIDIDGNSIATQILSFVKEYEVEGQKELTKKFQKKVVFSCKTLLKNQFLETDREKYDKWYKTHQSYYASPLRDSIAY